MKPCSSCGAQIAFIETPSGKKMPVDPELVKTFRAASQSPGDYVLVTERGETVKFYEVSLTHPDAEAIEGYVPHWSTCTTPAAHRR